ncbi:ADP-ribosylglycohydrolase [Aeromonas rivipollensis]
MNSTLILGQSAMPLIKGICYLLPAEQVGELVTVIAEEGGRLGAMPFIETGGTLPCTELRRLTRLALHIDRHRLDRTVLPIYQGREQLMAGAAALLDDDVTLACGDAMRLLALQLDKLLRGGRGSTQAKLDGLTLSVMEQRALAAQSPNTSAVVRGSWRRKSRNQLGRGNWLDVVEAALWCFWHSDALQDGEALLGALLGADIRVRVVYGMLAGAFYLAD